MKIVIADDEPLARERLRALLDNQDDVEVVAEVGDGHEALHACAEHDPDLVLLDIAMPGIDGMEVARHLQAFEPRPAVVFCTAYDAHALSAFDAEAVDYLVLTAGSFDIMVEVVCTSDADLLDLLNTRIRTLPGVVTAEVFVYLELRKQAYDWGTA